MFFLNECSSEPGPIELIFCQWDQLFLLASKTTLCCSIGNVFCFQIQRYNSLLKQIKSSLEDLQKGIQGLVVMSSDLEEVFNCINEARVPPQWAKVCYLGPNQLSTLYLISSLLFKLACFPIHAPYLVS